MEGGGGDNLAVAHNSEMWFWDGMNPIDGNLLSTDGEQDVSRPLLRSVEQGVMGFTLRVFEGLLGEDALIQEDTLSLSVDGAPVNADVYRDNGYLWIQYDQALFILAVHCPVGVSWLRNDGQSDQLDLNWQVAAYPTLSKAVTPLGSGLEPGFDLRVFQSKVGSVTPLTQPNCSC